MAARLFFLILSLHYLFLPGAKAQQDIQFNRISSEQGLPSDIINCIIQDKKGFIWVGTVNGLSRYDGHQFLNFKNIPGDTNSISNNNVISIANDQHDDIWAGTYWGGLNHFQKTKGTFSSYKNSTGKPYLLANNAIFGLQQLDASNFLIAQGTLTRLDVTTGSAVRIPMPENSWSDRKSFGIAQKFAPYRILIDKEKKWWLLGEAGIVKYDPVTNTSSSICNGPTVPTTFKNHSSFECREDKQGNLWIGNGAGLFYYNKLSGKLEQHYPNGFAAGDVKSPWIKSILCKDDGTVWFGTENGLFHYKPDDRSYSAYRNNPLNSFSLSNNNIQCLYEDRQQNIWVGTANGLNCIYPKQSPFKLYQSIPGATNSLQSNIAKASFKDKEGNTWIGTSAGLEFVDGNTGRTAIYKAWHKLFSPQAEFFVMPIFKNDEESIWVGTWGNGMQLFNTRLKKFVATYNHYADDSNSVCSNFIHSFCKDDEGNLWIATWNGGIDKYDIAKDRFEHFNESNNNSGVSNNYFNKITFVYNTIWAGNGDGLHMFDKRQNRFKYFPVDTAKNVNDAITAITPGPAGKLWVGTFNGLYLFDVAKQQFTDARNISAAAISDMLFSPPSSLWLATGEGLQLYDTASKKIKNYSLREGFPVSYFPVETYFHEASDGEIMVSSNSGLIHFYPTSISADSFKPDLYFTSIKVANEEKKELGDLTVLKRLDLNHDENNLSISFAALNYVNPSRNQYAYQLEGFDKDWVQLGNRHYIVFSSLQPGDYLLKIKASNDSGVWTDKELQLKIYVSTPWWKSAWFYTLCLLLVAGLAYLLYRVRINQLLAQQRLRNKIARDLHDDIGSTLSGIKLFSSLARHKLEEEKSGATAIVEKIGERSERMIEAMSDIVWSINPANDSIEKILVRMKQYAAEMLEPKNIDYRFSSDEKIHKLKLTDQSKKNIYLIFKEAINNAVKHASCTQVEISLGIIGKNLTMTIEDNGRGINLETAPGNGNGLNNFKQRAEEMAGSFEIESQPGKGTMLRLRVPVT